ncbi:hypothetical protein Vi05172_g8900 [Venturia inaequalis]|nr:hypothetical protein Vi05172_g8900 [Venturia inaequalis]
MARNVSSTAQMKVDLGCTTALGGQLVFQSDFEKWPGASCVTLVPPKSNSSSTLAASKELVPGDVTRMEFQKAAAAVRY